MTRTVLFEAAVTGFIGSTLRLGLRWLLAALIRVLFKRLGIGLGSALPGHPRGNRLVLRRRHDHHDGFRVDPARKAAHVPPVAAVPGEATAPPFYPSVVLDNGNQTFITVADPSGFNTLIDQTLVSGTLNSRDGTVILATDGPWGHPTLRWRSRSRMRRKPTPPRCARHSTRSLPTCRRWW
ncbi:MAG: hypothetical protein M0Z51_03730 [Propionibacterium sp.]|nr:hypothetical protein [Propionibacterium sp.]